MSSCNSRILKVRLSASCRICQSIVSYLQTTLSVGKFRSPITTLLPGVCPPESEVATFQAVLPDTWDGNLRPLVLQFAGTGDHYFWRRRTLMAKPLVKERKVGSIILGEEQRINL